MPLTGKTALVTGSSQGIGLAVARAFQAAGARVVLTSERPRSDLPDVETVLGRPGAHYFQADLGRDAEPERLVAEAWDWLGSIDVLVNNVGTYREPAYVYGYTLPIAQGKTVRSITLPNNASAAWLTLSPQIFFKISFQRFQAALRAFLLASLASGCSPARIKP